MAPDEPDPRGGNRWGALPEALRGRQPPAYSKISNAPPPRAAGPLQGGDRREPDIVGRVAELQEQNKRLEAERERLEQRLRRRPFRFAWVQLLIPLALFILSGLAAVWPIIWEQIGPQ